MRDMDTDKLAMTPPDTSSLPFKMPSSPPPNPPPKKKKKKKKSWPFSDLQEKKINQQSALKNYESWGPPLREDSNSIIKINNLQSCKSVVFFLTLFFANCFSIFYFSFIDFIEGGVSNFRLKISNLLSIL